MAVSLSVTGPRVGATSPSIYVELDSAVVQSRLFLPHRADRPMPRLSTRHRSPAPGETADNEGQSRSGSVSSPAALDAAWIPSTRATPQPAVLNDDHCFASVLDDLVVVPAPASPTPLASPVSDHRSLQPRMVPLRPKSTRPTSGVATWSNAVTPVAVVDPAALDNAVAEIAALHEQENRHTQALLKLRNCENDPTVLSTFRDATLLNGIIDATRAGHLREVMTLLAPVVRC